MARYEVSDGSSHKFWEITLVGKTFTVRWGRIGSRGQQTIKHFTDDATARAEYDKLVAEKRKKGYKLVHGTEEPDARRRASAAAAPSGLRNPDLEHAVTSDPNDEAALLVLADWLQTHGDPRGELIALHRALKHEKDPKLFLDRKRAAEAHLAAHEPALLGPLYDRRHLFRLEWQLGFIRTARVSFDAARDDDPEMATVIGELVDAPVALAMQELTLGMISAAAFAGAPDPSAGRYQAVLEELARRAAPRSLHTLFFGDFWPGTKAPERRAILGDLSTVLPAFPLLRKVVVDGGVLAYHEAALPELRHFEHRAPIDDATFGWLLASKFPNLEHLSLDVGMALVDLTRLFDRFPRVKTLRLFRTAGTDLLVEELARSKFLAQLEVLDLADGNLSDTGAARLVELSPSYRHLKTFHLGFQQLTYGATKRLREKTGIKVNDPRMYGN